MAGNLWKSSNSWEWLSRILGREGTNPRVYGVFLKAVVQAVLIFRSEMWAITPVMVRALGGFQHRVSRCITGRKPQRLLDRVWEYPHLETAIQEAGFE